MFRTGSSIAVYSENGEPLEQWAPYLPGSLQSAKGISFGENQFVIRTMGHPLPDRVAIYNSNREFEVDWYEPNLSGWPGVGSDVLTVGLDGMIYLLGFGEETVYKYDPDEGLVNSWSTVGTDTTGASWPFGVAVNKQGLVYISNTIHDQVLCFSTEGDLLAEYGGAGQWPRSIQ